MKIRVSPRFRVFLVGVVLMVVVGAVWFSK